MTPEILALVDEHIEREVERRLEARAQGIGAPDLPSLPVDLVELLASIEERYIDAALESAHDNRKDAAALLGLGRTTLVEKLRRRAARRPSPTT